MFIKNYSQLCERLAKEMPQYEYVMSLGVLYMNDPNKHDAEASINITLRGYLLVVPRSKHEGYYTDVETLIGALQTMLRETDGGAL